MTRHFERLYARLGRLHYAAFMGFHVATGVILTVVAVGIFATYEPLHGGDWWVTVALGELCVLTSFATGAWLLRPTWRPLQVWLDGTRDPVSAAAAWRSALALPLVSLRIQFPVSAALAAVPVTAFVGLHFDLSTTDTLLFLFGMLVAAVYPAALDLLLLEAWLRPVVREAAGHTTSVPAPPSPRLSLEGRLKAVIPATTIVSAGFVAVFASIFSDTSISDLARSTGVAALVGILAAAVLTPLLSDYLLFGVRELTATAERLAAGAGPVHTPVLASDETGALAVAVNEMVDAITEREALREREARLRGEALERETRQVEAIAQAVESERAAIARELHGIVTDEVSELAARADGLARATRDGIGGELVRAGLEGIENDGRAVLAHLRGFLGVLRSAPPAATSPQPSVADLEGLLAAARAAGALVRLRRETPGEIPRGVAVSAYRIVQDLLGDALGGGGLREVDVTLTSRDDALELEVVLRGRVGVGAGSVRASDRAALLGGSASVALEGDRETVRAVLPLEAGG